MIESRIDQLVNAGVDGTLSRRRQRRLEALRSERADVETAYQELTRTVDRLQSLRRIDPPGNLKERILEALPPPAKRRAEHRPTVFRPRPMMIIARPAFRLAAAFVAGLVAATLVFVLNSRSEATDELRAAGTMGANAARQVEEADPTVVEMRANGFVGTAAIARRGRQVTLTVTGTTESGASVMISYAPEQATFRGYVDRSSGASAVASVSAGAVSLAPQGATELTFTFETPDAGATRFVVEIRDPNGTGQEQELTI